MMKIVLSTILSFLLFIGFSVSHAEENPLVEAMIEYMDFASYSDGTMSKSQVEAAGLDNLFVIDARSQERYEAAHIPGAVNIEWRQVLNHMDEIPTDQTVLLYCDSGLLSSKAHFALKLAGYENVRVLLGGYAAWQ